MCGIAGILGIEDGNEGKRRVSRMVETLVHRGPDDEGYFTDKNVALGHRRLSIIDLSSAGRQPMRSSDRRYEIVYNGELYNYEEVKRLIPEYPFQSKTDTEVILAAFGKWGEACLQHFNGMFSFAIWDREKKELFMARDRLGIKPLYYYQKDGLFVFSSEVRALFASGLVPRKLNFAEVSNFLRYQTVYAPETMVRDVLLLLPGHFMKVSEGRCQIHEYWDASRQIDQSSDDQSAGEVHKNVRALLRNAVQRRLVSDVPLGVFLSGGIDSSAVVGLMSEVSKKRVHTFSVIFDETAYTEAGYARTIAEKFRTDHHELRLLSKDLLNDLPQALDAMDHPSGDGVNTYVIAKAVKKASITVALSGLGGDEVFAGYPCFKQSRMFLRNQWLWKMPGAFREFLGKGIRRMCPGTFSEKLFQLLSLEKNTMPEFYSMLRRNFMEDEIRGLRPSHDFPGDLLIGPMLERIWDEKAGGKAPFLSRVSISEIMTYLQNILLRDSDQMGMSHALEIRLPFLDYKLVEYVLGVRDDLKVSSIPKNLLVKSLGDILPPATAHRKKMGFVFPWALWLRGELKEFCQEKIVSLSKRGIFDREMIQDLWARFLRADPRVNWSKIWGFVVLENWIKTNSLEK